MTTYASNVACWRVACGAARQMALCLLKRRRQSPLQRPLQRLWQLPPPALPTSRGVDFTRYLWREGYSPVKIILFFIIYYLLFIT